MLSENSMSQKSHNKPEGNTKTSGSRNQLYNWIFVIPREECDASQLSQLLHSFPCKKFTYQLERSESGYEHWQGFFSLKTKEYFNTVKNMFPNTTHIEGAKNIFKADNYSKKIETRIEGPYNEKSVFLECLKFEQLYKWQKNILNICSEKPSGRTINWYWSEQGNLGKSSFCKYLVINHNAFFAGDGKKGDIYHAFKADTKIILFDVPRYYKDHFNYGTLEGLCNGLIFSGKYDSSMKIFNPVHIFVFCNFPPDTSSMSEDRWNIVNLDI